MTDPSSITVSLETAKKFREAGWKQEGWLWWAELSDNQFVVEDRAATERSAELYDGFMGCSWIAVAPTVSELWEAIRALTPSEDVHLETCHGQTEACVRASTCDFEDVPWFEGNNPQEALAKLWIYLKEHGLLPEQ